MAVFQVRLASPLLFCILALQLTITPGPSASETPRANPQTTNPAGNSAISGVVTDGRTGRPIAGALVSLSDAKVSVSMVTDSQGRFVFAGLPASPRYLFRARKSGYYNVGKGQADPSAGPSTSIALAEKEWRQNEDVVLWPFGAISGMVVDERGERVVGVPVNVLARIAAGGSVQWVGGPQGITDDRGIYRIDQLRRGTYVVQVANVHSTVPSTTSPAHVAGTVLSVTGTPSGAVPPAVGLDVAGVFLALGHYAVPPPLDGQYRTYPPLYYPGTPSLTSATAVDLDDGEQQVGLNFVMQPVASFSVSGRVVGPLHAAPGLVVRVLAGENSIAGRGGELATAMVDKDGTFTLVGVPAGQYTLFAAPWTGDLTLKGSGARPATPGLALPASFHTVDSTIFSGASPSAGIPYTGRMPVMVDGRDVMGLALELSPGATVRGSIVTEDGSPLRDDVTVYLSGSGDPTFMTSFSRVSAKAAAPVGFLMSGMREGRYFINAESGPRPSRAVKAITGPGGDYTNRPIHAKPGDDIDVIITLSDRAATLTGAVRDREGAIVPHAAVMLFPADRSQWSQFGLNPPNIKWMVAAGRDGYKLSRLRAGDYLAIATDSSQSQAWHDTRFLEAAAALATPVTLAWGDSTVLNLTLRQVTVR